MKNIKPLLKKIRDRKISIHDAFLELQNLPFQDIGCAKIDSHRSLRRGFPEVIFGENKKDEDLLAIAGHMVKRCQTLLITRISGKTYHKLKALIPALIYCEDSRTAYMEPVPARRKGLVLIVTAGTSDLKVAKEAEITARVMGNRVRVLTDVGVAGVHRLLDHIGLLRKANVLVVIAGMEGALPSVISGLVSKPVVAVPTSVGYGASFKGVAPLLTMLNSCSPGVVVCNIDNGFGAGYFASIINR